VIIKNKAEKFRFGVVGFINTGIDFGLFFSLKYLGLPTVTANIVGSTVAFTTSFVLNKRVTFRATGTNFKREVLLFVIVTLFGLWVIQSAVILLFEWLLRDIVSVYMALLVGKVVATGITLIWNYEMYSRFVFKKPQSR